jgi:SAM-dependent methyltransferase
MFQRRTPAGHLSFVCNICGHRTSAALDAILERERPTCGHCQSSLRFRALIAALLNRLLRETKPLKQIQTDKAITGLGMSDERLYSRLLERKFDYLNTFYDMEPRLDITDPDSRFSGRFDFVVCSDVMEHVQPPIEHAFKNLRALLRPGGLLLLSVPFTDKSETVEHFPALYQFEITGKGKDRRLVNLTRKGERQVFDNLMFHEGKGATLEMRIFSKGALLQIVRESGFNQIQVHHESIPQWGIVHPHRYSVPITAIAS